MTENTIQPATLRIDVGVPLRPEEYVRLVVGVWALLMCRGHEKHARIERDGSATDEQIADGLEQLIQSCPWGW